MVEVEAVPGDVAGLVVQHLLIQPVDPVIPREVVVEALPEAAEEEDQYIALTNADVHKVMTVTSRWMKTVAHQVKTAHKTQSIIMHQPWENPRRMPGGIHRVDNQNLLGTRHHRNLMNLHLGQKTAWGTH